MNSLINPKNISLDDYQRLTLTTDKNPTSGYAGLRFPILGLFGEVGGLLSELKKKQRDNESYIGYKASVMEEFGDTMWYFANTVEHAGLHISELAQKAHLSPEDWNGTSVNSSLGFKDIQSNRQHKGPVNDKKFESGAIMLAGKVGGLLDAVSNGRIDANRDTLSSYLIEIFRALVHAAEDADISLADAAERNIAKTTSRWPQDRVYPPLFDIEYDTDEQLPRKIRMLVAEKIVDGKAFVIQKCNDVKIGDQLTDNKAEKDDYRFHDVLHLANAAILGWSPVIRALFKVKRKSRPEIDETQDGARAIVIEEGVTTWVFNHAVHLEYLAKVNSLDYSLLKAIKEFVKGYEVERCPLWLWEEAILEGYKVFRFLREHRKAVVTADLSTRSISFEPV